MHHAEVLDKDGNFYPDTLRQAASVDTYILDGTLQTLHPHFTFHGFRYIRLEGLSISDIRCEDFTACTLHSDMKRTGTFSCSDPLVTRLWENIEWGMRSNFLDIPTDCPQRDERLGWTGDAQVFAATASYLCNTALFYEKWLRDLKAEHKNHLSTGFVGTPYICHALSDNGQHELAGTLFLQEDYPSWLYAVKKGATTIWERWDSIKPDGTFDESGMNSLNHYAYGSIGEWMYKKILGIHLLEPGYKKFSICPMLTKGITSA